MPDEIDDETAGAIGEVDFDAYVAPRAPAELADRVMARLTARRAAGRSRRPIAAAAALACAATLLLLWLTRPRPLGGAGRTQATAALAIRLTPAITARLEPSTDLRWRTLGGAADITQATGRATYAIARPAEIHTHAGTIATAGATLELEIEAMTNRSRGGAAALTVAVAVTAGTAWIRSADGDAALTAGQRATLAVGRAPAVSHEPGSPGAGPVARARRIDPPRRAALLTALAAAREAREADQAGQARSGRSGATERPGAQDPTAQPAAGTIDKETIRAVVSEAFPLVAECYDVHLAAHPGRAGQVRVNFAITGEPGVAGLVEDAEILAEDAKEGLGADPEFGECLRETLLSLEFPPPEVGGSVRVTFPFRFEPAAELRPR